MPVELGLILRRLAEMAEQDQALREHQPWQAAYERDYAWLGGVIEKHYAGDDNDVKVLMAGILPGLRGQTVEEYAAAAATFLDQAPHPTLGRRLRDCSYLPMVELPRYVEGHDFTCFIASGGSRDFMRTLTDDLYGVPPERGSADARKEGHTGEPAVPPCSLHHVRHTPRHPGRRRSLLRRLRDDGLGREDVLRDRSGVLERRTRDHRRVDDPGLDEVLDLA
jgi:hypothetical protein